MGISERTFNAGGRRMAVFIEAIMFAGTAFGGSQRRQAGAAALNPAEHAIPAKSGKLGD